jgi:hypothetical protein
VNHLEHHLFWAFKSLLMLLLPASGEFLLDFPSPKHLSLVPTLLISLAWETTAREQKYV